MYSTEIQENKNGYETTTLVKCLEESVLNGFIENFHVLPNGLCTVKNVCYPADQLELVDFYRFEGESDPDDNSILYLIRSKDGIKGSLVDAYGVYSDPDINIFMRGVRGNHQI